VSACARLEKRVGVSDAFQFLHSLADHIYLSYTTIINHGFGVNCRTHKR